MRIDELDASVLKNKEIPQSYEFRLDLFGNEILMVNISTTSTRDRWVAITLVTIFSSLTIFGAYGDKFVGIVKSIFGG